MSRRASLFVALLCLLGPPAGNQSHAHPVPNFAYDRVIQVKLTPQGVEVAYQLNVDEITIFRDVTRLLDDVERSKLRTGNDIREAFSKAMAPILTDRLEASLGGKPLTFACVRRSHEVKDHAQCDYVFLAKWPMELAAGQVFRLQETNFEDQKGQVDLTFAADQQVTLASRLEPDSGLKAKPSVERTRAEEERLRLLGATIAEVVTDGTVNAVVESPHPTEPQAELTLWEQLQARGPVALLDSSLGFGLVLLLTGVFGAAHALTPGHGKTLVASYLVGERGTVGHALLLGLVTTITHTGVVLLLSVVLWLGVGVSPANLQAALSFLGGLLIAGMGLWLLLRRLAGQADHFHIGAGHDHQHGHDHRHEQWLPPATGEKVRIWNLIVLGIGGGIVPCYDAITIQLAVVAKGQLWLGPVLILAFSVGLAATLVMVGIAVVKLKGFGVSRWGQGRLVRILPLVSAVAITVIGIWLCVDAIPKGSH